MGALPFGTQASVRKIAMQDDNARFVVDTHGWQLLAGSVEARIKRMRAIRKRSRILLKDGPSAVEHGDFLYDENGLPN